MVKLVTLPYEIYQELLERLPSERRAAIEEAATVTLKVDRSIVTNQESVEVEDVRRTFGQRHYKPGATSRREQGSLGRFG